MFQINLPEGKSPDNWYNIDRDMAHVFDKLVRQVALDIPDDAIVPKPTEPELKAICEVFQDIFLSVLDKDETPDSIGARLDKLPDNFRCVFERALTLNLFKRYTKWKREIAPKVKPKLDAL